MLQQDDIGEMLGISREAVRQKIQNFYHTVWQFCPEDIQEKYPFEELKAHIVKPMTLKTKTRKGRARGKSQGGSGVSVLEKPIKPISKAERGRRRNIELDKQMIHPPEDFKGMQKMMDKTRRRYFESRRKCFKTSSDLIVAAGIGEKGTSRSRKVIQVLNTNNIAHKVLHTKRTENGRLYWDDIVFVHISDEDRAVEAVKNNAHYILS